MIYLLFIYFGGKWRVRASDDKDVVGAPLFVELSHHPRTLVFLFLFSFFFFFGFLPSLLFIFQEKLNEVDRSLQLLLRLVHNNAMRLS
jgi:hypothetical protein